MKVLFISKDGSSLGLAERVKNEGHIATMHLAQRGGVGEGMVDRAKSTSSNQEVKKDIDKLMDEVKPNLVIIDREGIGKVADYIRGGGIPVVGGCRWADHATLDLEYGRKLMKQVGIEIDDTKSKEGIEVECEMWWDGLHPIIHNVTFKERRFMNDGVGPEVECTGCIVKMVSPANKLIREGVGKMERLLKKVNYYGPLSLRCKVNEGGLFGVSLNVGFNYDSVQALLEIHKGNVTQLLHSIATSSNGYGEFSKDYATSVRLSLPPYPHGRVRDKVEIGGVNSENVKHLWWKGVKKNKSGSYESVVGDGNVVTVVARGRYVDECKSRVYRTIRNLDIKDVQYRTDIGKHTNKSEKKLKQLGYNI